MNAERRSRPRLSGAPCPHCDSTRVFPHHLRDTGDMDPAEAIAAGYCPTLVAKRNARPAQLVPTDAREAARLSEWHDLLTADDMADAYAAALSGEAPR